MVAGFRIVMLAALLAGADLVPGGGTVPRGDPPCVQAKKWVASHENQLPSTYDAFSAYSITWQKAIYSALDLQTREVLWKAHLDDFENRFNLSPEQKAFIATARTDLGRYLRSQSRSTELEKRSKQILGPELTRLAFVELGELDKSIAEQTEACACSTVHGGCPSGYACTDNGCDPVSCGFLGHDTCNGTCWKAQQ